MSSKLLSKYEMDSKHFGLINHFEPSQNFFTLDFPTIHAAVAMPKTEPATPIPSVKRKTEGPPGLAPLASEFAAFVRIRGKNLKHIYSIPN